jgi:LPXTG-motif cell wall-anchored protein
LAFTGSDTRSMTLLALMVLLVGGLLVWLARRSSRPFGHGTGS